MLTHPDVCRILTNMGFYFHMQPRKTLGCGIIRRMLTYADVCRMLTYAEYADLLTYARYVTYADVCCMLTYADVFLS
eukprot:31548_3